MGRRAKHFKCPIRYLQRSWAAESGLPCDLYEYLAGVAAGLLDWANARSLDYFDRMLVADCGRLHRAQVESKPDGMTRARMVGAFDRAMGRLERKRGRLPSWPAGKARMRPPTRRMDDSKDSTDSAA